MWFVLSSQLWTGDGRRGPPGRLADRTANTTAAALVPARLQATGANTAQAETSRLPTVREECVMVSHYRDLCYTGCSKM